jgi:ribonuclease P protein component
MPTHTFKKTERLKSRKAIEQLFKNGNSFGAYPLRLVFAKVTEEESDFPVQFTVSVSKKRFKSAVARNRIKRKVREAWRCNKHWLYGKLEGELGQYAFMVIYTATEDFDYKTIAKSIRSMNMRFLKKKRARQSMPSPKS